MTRDARIDNARAVLIFLVVLGHLLEMRLDGWQRPVTGTLLTLIYAFHMPAFVFLSGTTARTDGLARRILFVLVLLVLFQAAYTVPGWVLGGEYPGSPWQPFWILWFLLSLACWMALLPLFTRLRPPIAVAAAVVLCLASGTVAQVGYPLGLSRTLVFLPFFVAGHFYGKALFAALPRHAWVKAALTVGMVAIAAAVYARYGSPNQWLYGSHNSAELGVGAFAGVGIRGALLLLAALGSLTLFSWTPGRASWLSRIGAASLSVFVLHGLVLRLLRWHFEGRVPDQGLVVELTAALALATLLTFALGQPLFDRALRGVAGWPGRRLGL